MYQLGDSNVIPFWPILFTYNLCSYCLFQLSSMGHHYAQTQCKAIAPGHGESNVFCVHRSIPGLSFFFKAT